LDKNSFRKKCLKKLKVVSQQSRYYKDYLVSRKIEELIDNLDVKNILVYLPLGIEVDLQKLMKKYRRKKFNIFVPFIEQESFKMVKYRLPLKKEGSFKILQSPNSNLIVEQIDMIIVPVVGVDGNYKRVGFGKGMYDRFYEKLRKKPIVVFVQRDSCYTREDITDWHDISADFYITP